MVKAEVSPELTAASSRPARLRRKVRSASSCQSVCSTELRAVPAAPWSLPGASVPCALVEELGCSCTSLVWRFGNISSPRFSRMSALRPSHTTSQSPLSILILSIAQLQSDLASRLFEMLERLATTPSLGAKLHSWIARDQGWRRFPAERNARAALVKSTTLG